MVVCIIDCCTPCDLHHIFVIRGWNLVYEVETEAAKLKSSGTVLGPGMDGGLARLRQVFPPAPGPGWLRGGKGNSISSGYRVRARPVRERADRPRAVRAKFQGGGRHAA